jgi:hypothetical protein
VQEHPVMRSAPDIETVIDHRFVFGPSADPIVE